MTSYEIHTLVVVRKNYNASSGRLLPLCESDYILGARMDQYIFSANMPCFKSRFTLILTVFLTNLQIIESYQEISFCPKELVFNPRGVSKIIKLQNKEKCKLCFIILVP